MGPARFRCATLLKVRVQYWRYNVTLLQIIFSQTLLQHVTNLQRLGPLHLCHLTFYTLDYHAMKNVYSSVSKFFVNLLP